MHISKCADLIVLIKSLLLSETPVYLSLLLSVLLEKGDSQLKNDFHYEHAATCPFIIRPHQLVAHWFFPPEVYWHLSLLVAPYISAHHKDLTRSGEKWLWSSLQPSAYTCNHHKTVMRERERDFAFRKQNHCHVQLLNSMIQKSFFRISLLKLDYREMVDGLIWDWSCTDKIHGSINFKVHTDCS